MAQAAGLPQASTASGQPYVSKLVLLGSSSVGKTSLVQLLAHLTGHTLKIMAMNSAMDTTELLGGFEQVPSYTLT